MTQDRIELSTGKQLVMRINWINNWMIMNTERDGEKVDSEEKKKEKGS